MQLSRFFSIGLVMSLALTLSACGGKDEKDAAKKASEKLVGKWSVDANAMIKKMEAMATTEEAKQDLEQARQEMGSMKMDMAFTADGKMSMDSAFGGFTDSKEGTYTVTSEEAGTVVISGTMDEETKKATIKFLDDDTIDVTIDGEEQVMSFKRAK